MEKSHSNIVANENRLKILVALGEKPKTWSELMFECKVNPKALRDHLQVLADNHLIEKFQNNMYRATSAGQALISMSITNMMETAQICF